MPQSIDLVIDTVSEGVQATVSPRDRETVAAVAELEKETGLPVSVTQAGRAPGHRQGRGKPARQRGPGGRYLVDTADATKRASAKGPPRQADPWRSATGR